MGTVVVNVTADLKERALLGVAVLGAGLLLLLTGLADTMSAGALKYAAFTGSVLVMAIAGQAVWRRATWNRSQGWLLIGLGLGLIVVTWILPTFTDRYSAVLSPMGMLGELVFGPAGNSLMDADGWNWSVAGDSALLIWGYGIFSSAGYLTLVSGYARILRPVDVQSNRSLALDGILGLVLSVAGVLVIAERVEIPLDQAGLMLAPLTAAVGLGMSFASAALARVVQVDLLLLLGQLALWTLGQIFVLGYLAGNLAEDYWLLLGHAVAVSSFLLLIMASMARPESTLWKGNRSVAHERSAANASGLGVPLALIAFVLLWTTISQQTTDSNWGLAATNIMAVASVLRLATNYRRVYRMTDGHRQARVDELTGLLNRRGLYEQADVTLAEGFGNRKTAFILLDLDRFKEVNDILGHAAGDLLLSQFGRRLSRIVRADDFAARLGGDEFAVLLPHTSHSEAMEVAERIRLMLTRPFTVGATTLHVEASVGIATSPPSAATRAELMRCADVAMYEAKRQRNGIVTYSRDQDDPDRLRTVEDLRAALNGTNPGRYGRIVVHYQPQVRMTDGSVHGMEALARWERPDHGLMPPSAFLPLAQTVGLMDNLTNVVMEQAAASCSRWWKSGQQLPISINLPGSGIHDTGLIERMGALVQKYNLPPQALTLEITEDTLMSDPPLARRVLTDARDMGVAIAVDDYGTGYSSLAYLRQLPVDELKLDKAFLDDLMHEDSAAVLVQHVTDLAHALGLRLVAEGIDDPDVAFLLAAMGCDIGQGFLFAHPMPHEELADWLAGTDEMRTRMASDEWREQIAEVARQLRHEPGLPVQMLRERRARSGAEDTAAEDAQAKAKPVEAPQVVMRNEPETDDQAAPESIPLAVMPPLQRGTEGGVAEPNVVTAPNVEESVQDQTREQWVKVAQWSSIPLYPGAAEASVWQVELPPLPAQARPSHESVADTSVAHDSAAHESAGADQAVPGRWSNVPLGLATSERASESSTESELAPQSSAEDAVTASLPLQTEDVSVRDSAWFPGSSDAHWFPEENALQIAAPAAQPLTGVSQFTSETASETAQWQSDQVAAESSSAAVQELRPETQWISEQDWSAASPAEAAAPHLFPEESAGTVMADHPAAPAQPEFVAQPEVAPESGADVHAEAHATGLPQPQPNARPQAEFEEETGQVGAIPSGQAVPPIQSIPRQATDAPDYWPPQARPPVSANTVLPTQRKASWGSWLTRGSR